MPGIGGLIGSATSVASGNLFTRGAGQAAGVLGLRWRLFDFGRINAQIDQARGQEAESLAAYRLAVLRASEDVENAFSALVKREDFVPAAYRAMAFTDCELPLPGGWTGDAKNAFTGQGLSDDDAHRVVVPTSPMDLPVSTASVARPLKVCQGLCRKSSPEWCRAVPAVAVTVLCDWYSVVVSFVRCFACVCRSCPESITMNW